MDVFIQFEKKPLLFQRPEFIISCADPARIGACFQEIETALGRGYYLAGFFSYEAGYYFEERLREKRASDFPLLFFGAYKTPEQRPWRSSSGARPGLLSNLRLSRTQEEYSSHIGLIRDHISAGDVYQITYCIKLLFSFNGRARTLYEALLKSQPVPYPAYLETDQFQILSCSPEMFVKKTGTHVITKPMKGTWPRGEAVFSDWMASRRFRRDSKNRAENLMIADLLRNDLGRIGAKIRAPKLFEVAKYRMLYQMTSTVTGEVEKDIPLYKLFASIFPSGSVTGAPKIRAMQIIRELEKEDRRIYTGAIGYIAPNKDLFFNVPIRTLLLRGESGEMGIGGGIVWDSTPQGEWDEGLLKAKFVTERAAG